MGHYTPLRNVTKLYCVRLIRDFSDECFRHTTLKSFAAGRVRVKTRSGKTPVYNNGVLLRPTQQTVDRRRIVSRNVGRYAAPDATTRAAGGGAA